MSFSVDVERQLGDTHIAARFEAEGGITALFGPSGAGKTSVLNMIAGLMRPDRGSIRVDGTLLFDSATGVSLPPEHRRLGYVFQDARLFPHRRVRGNLLYGHHLARPEDRWMSLDHAVEFLGIGHLLDRWPATLSGGEAQRVAIGRALLSGARFLLMDEPLASLDRARREEILRVIEAIRDEMKLPILYVSHDRAEVDRLASSIVLIGE
ncbi:MAG: molybdenum ABC transporter ATP-binding protein [Sphingobium sp.]|jgi:molybdate transport system ATP-binding protein|nr:molybdenum ABC transporter ATP-binding protein [Sphingobium sp.]MCI1271751.1 molybdenum ABC transporter ATP-binding protein [Sphingobium sp.]MCI1755181.1 molybdenum ABC transporter ATP-binding protein [Sphingobium sp.]MCI2054035.1 molybdenum ABC transporter ATP-binding protein [Sphingobium sp.]